MDEKWDQKARDALIRISKAFRYGRGVRVSWEELEVLNRTHIGELWSEIEQDSLPSPAQPHQTRGVER